MPFVLPSLSSPSAISRSINRKMDSKLPSVTMAIVPAPCDNPHLFHQQPSMAAESKAQKNQAIAAESISTSSQNTHSKLEAASFSELLKEPLTFIPASRLTVYDEMVVLRSQSLVQNLNILHRRRRKQLSRLPKPKSPAKKIVCGFPNPEPRIFCYRRSMVQSFVHIDRLLAYLSYYKRNSPCHPNGGPPECLLCRFLALISTSRVKIKDIELLKRWVKRRTNEFDRMLRLSNPNGTVDWIHSNDQEDAHDVLLYIVHKLYDNFNWPHGIIQSLFKSCISSSWQCDNCKEISLAAPTEETSLQVPIDPSDRRKKGNREASVSLEECLHRYFNDTLPGVRCDGCGSAGLRKRQLKLEAAPEALFIQLKRFRRNSLNQFEKDETPVAVPKFLHLDKYAAERPQARDHAAFTYRLQSVVAHHGSLRAGHYIAYAMRGGTVWRFDDFEAKQVSLEEMLVPVVYEEKEEEVKEGEEGKKGKKGKKGGKAKKGEKSKKAKEGKKTVFTPYILTYVSCEGVPEEE